MSLENMQLKINSLFNGMKYLTSVLSKLLSRGLLFLPRLNFRCLKLSISDSLYTIGQELKDPDEIKALRVLVLLEALLQTELFLSSRSVQEAASTLNPFLENILNNINQSEQVVLKSKKILCILQMRSSNN
jgi:hypothetical protein